MQLAALSKRLEDRDITLQLTDAAALFVLAQSYDPLYGARPLRRFLEKHIVTEVSKLIIKGDLTTNALVTIDAAPGAAGGADVGRLTFKITPTEPKSKRKGSAAGESKDASLPTAMDTSSDEPSATSSSSSSSTARGKSAGGAGKSSSTGGGGKDKEDSRTEKKRRLEGR